MKKQTLIADRDLNLWKKSFAEHLNAGWTVVPGTLQVSVSMGGENGMWIAVYVVVLERFDETPVKQSS